MSESESYSPNWREATLHWNPDTGEVHVTDVIFMKHYEALKKDAAKVQMDNAGNPELSPKSIRCNPA